MQFSRLILSLVAIVPNIFALQPPHPDPTDKATDALGLENGVSPKPTDSPALPAVGYMPHANLFARDQEVFTCGFTDGDSAYPLTCGPTSGCSFATSPHYYFGCCQFTGSVNSNNQWDGTYGTDCYTVGACTGYDDHPYTIENPEISGDAVLCGYDAKYCATSYMFDVPGYEGTYTHYDCVTSASIIDLEWNALSDASYSPTATEAPVTETATVTRVSVSVVIVSVTPTDDTSTSTSTSSTSTSSSSSATAESASSSTTSSSTDGAQILLPTGLGLAVVAGIAAML